MSSSQPLVIAWWPTAYEQKDAEDQGRSLMIRFEVHSRLGQKLHGGLEPAHRLPKDMPVLVLLAPTDVGLFAIETPRISGRKLKDALPFLVEPFILNEPEENLVSVWPKYLRTDGPTQLASVLEKRRAREVLDTCTKLGLKLIGLSCESLRKPTVEQPAVWLSGDFVYMADGLTPPMIASKSQSTLIRAKLGQSMALSVSANDAPWFAEQLGQDRINTSEGPVASPLASLSDCLLTTPEDLRKLGFRGKSTIESPWKSLQKPALVLAASAIVSLNAVAFQERHNLETINSQIEQAYQKALPDTPMIADPLLLIEREKNKLNSGQQSGQNRSIAWLLHEVGLAMDTAPFNSMAGFAWQDNTLTLRFQANVQQADQDAAAQKLKARNLEARWLIGGTSKLPLLQVNLPNGGRP